MTCHPERSEGPVSRQPWHTAWVTLLRTMPLALLIAATASAQQTPTPAMGTIATQDAQLSGSLEVSNDQARLLSNVSITARDHTAPIALDRGGDIQVCSTSQFHLLRSGTGKSLLFGLDRGAIEIHSRSEPQDSILTPDLRFTLESPGTFDLSLRVNRDGDTCVDNAGVNAPTILLNDAFSSAVYRLIPGQHVLFEHGSLREVVDNEKSPCGCPAPTVDVAAATITAAPGTPAATAAEHPFPAAASEDLAPTKPLPITPAAPSTDSATTFIAGKPPAAAPPTPRPATATSPNGTPNGTGADDGPPPPAPPSAHGIAHAIAHFFHKLFHPHSGAATKPSAPPA
jgi:hypothetical protein